MAVGRIEAGWEGGGKSGEKKGEGKGDYPMDFYSVSSGLRFWGRVEMMSREVVDGTSERAELTRFVRFRFSFFYQDDSLGPWTPRHGLARPKRVTVAAASA